MTPCANVAGKFLTASLVKVRMAKAIGGVKDFDVYVCLSLLRLKRKWVDVIGVKFARTHTQSLTACKAGDVFHEGRPVLSRPLIQTKSLIISTCRCISVIFIMLNDGTLPFRITSLETRWQRSFVLLGIILS